jgi:hypothetical protein
MMACKVADQPEIIIIHLNKVHKAADLPEMKAILLLPEPKADQVILLLHHHMAAAVAALLVVEAAVVQDHQELEEVNYKI